MCVWRGWRLRELSPGFTRTALFSGFHPHHTHTHTHIYTWHTLTLVATITHTHITLSVDSSVALWFAVVWRVWQTSYGEDWEDSKARHGKKDHSRVFLCLTDLDSVCVWVYVCVCVCVMVWVQFWLLFSEIWQMELLVSLLPSESFFLLPLLWMWFHFGPGHSCWKGAVFLIRLPVPPASNAMCTACPVAVPGGFFYCRPPVLNRPGLELQSAVTP